MSDITADCEPTNLSVQTFCKYCSELCEPYNNPSLQCMGECDCQIHIKCLRRGGLPGSLIGDVFFKLFCQECSPLAEETLTRDKISWLTIIILTLYHLRDKSSGISKRGYFHWRSDIATFVEKNWDYLAPKNVKRKKQWVGTISGTLSHYSGTFFQSGTIELGESGWWKLMDSSDPPEVLIDKYNQMILKRKKQPGTLQVKTKAICPSPPRSESSLSIGDDSCTGESSRIQTPSMFSREYVQPSEVLSDYLMADDDMPDLDIEDTDLSDESPFFADLVKDYQPATSNFQQLAPFNSDWMTTILSQVESDSNSGNPRNDGEAPMNEETSDDSCAPMEAPQNSLFTSTIPREYPWKAKPKSCREKTEKMSHNELCYLLQSVPKRQLRLAPPSIRRAHRKLALRKLKYEYNLPILDIDTFGIDAENKDIKALVKRKNRVIDRFYSSANFALNFEQRLQGYAEPTSIHSPYTNRLLKPFIRQDRESQPLWLRILDELRGRFSKSNEASENLKIDERGSIDYCYVRPQHIPAMNSLCSQFFWPGIDLTECLQYPDFTCVVLYKKIVIGFAILVPDVGYNEAYISFFLTRPEWRHCGIGTFMLYHLIQTCMGKDVTLHVSVTNPALILYQKFGFKIEEFVQDFYDKYMAQGTRESRHALFLRLSR